MFFRLAKYAGSHAVRGKSLAVEFRYNTKAFYCILARTFTVMNSRSSLGRDLFVLLDAKVKLFEEKGGTSSAEGEIVDDGHDKDDEDAGSDEGGGGADNDNTEQEEEEGEEDQMVDDWNRVQVEYVPQLSTPGVNSLVCFPYWFSIERSRMQSNYTMSCMQVLNGKSVFDIAKLKCEDAVSMISQFEESVTTLGRNVKYVSTIRSFDVENFVDCNRNNVVLQALEHNLL